MRHHMPILLLTGALLAPQAAWAADFAQDPLTAGSWPDRGSQGGSFGPSGFTTTGKEDAIWYEIPAALPTGAVEFSVTGVSTATTLDGADHDIFAMYMGLPDHPEPVDYSPWFRDNDFKVFLRLFGTQEPDRAGAMKIEFALCPHGPPWVHSEGCPEGCDFGDLAYAYGKDEDIGWDPAKWYTIRVAWSPGWMAFYRDGLELGSVGYPGTYAPKPLRVRIGSPRHGVSSVAYMPVGLTFRDVKITGEPGVPTTICGEPPVTDPPDAGASDAGSSDAGSTGGALVFHALADVTAAEWSTTPVFADVTDLNVESDGAGQPNAVGYIRFPAPEGDVHSAILRLHTHTFGSAEGGGGLIHPVADSSWSEATMTWATRPAYGPQGIAGPAMVDSNEEAEWDVTALVAAGTTSFAVVTTHANGVHYMSKEAGGAELGPRLYVESTPLVVGPDSGSTSDSGGTDAGAPSADIEWGGTDGGPEPGGPDGGTVGTGDSVGSVDSAGAHDGSSGQPGTDSGPALADAIIGGGFDAGKSQPTGAAASDGGSDSGCGAAAGSPPTLIAIVGLGLLAAGARRRRSPPEALVPR